MKRVFCICVVAAGALLSATACDDGSEADRKGVGAECAKVEDCQTGQQCLAFKGGYCGLQGCTADSGCPAGSACVNHVDGIKYCFRVCVEKVDCNRNRSVENESNCVANITFVEGSQNRKACVPPSSS
jgi:hypothetical protein